ncbi:MAG TPA: NAD(P)/FAD-dependent oxidoreductase [Jiangellaceae bacterium]
MSDLDVIVVGGGPIGLAAAVEARLAGLSVVVYEPRSTPVDKACGEGLMPGAVVALDRLGVRPHGIPFVGIRYAEGDLAVEHRFRAGPGLGVRRTELHRALAARVADLDIEVVRERVDVVRQETRCVSTADGRRARWMLACDGLHSTLRRELGLDRGPHRVARYGLRRHFHVMPWTDLVEVHWTPAAEIYVTPVDDELVGVAVLGAKGTDYDVVLRQANVLSDQLAGAAPVSDLRGAGPLRQPTSGRTHRRVLLVGDASGYVDALTGEGIRLGLAQARAAVAAVIAGRPEVYERDWRRLSRDYRLLTTALVSAAVRPAIRRRIVPMAVRLPRVYGSLVERLAS